MRGVSLGVIVLAAAAATACNGSPANSGSSSSASTPPSVSSNPSASSRTTVATATTAATTTSSPAPTVASSAPRADAAWLTFGGSADRRGSVASGPDPGALSQAWSSDAVDGALYGEPIVSGGRVVVATEHDSVYAFDTRRGQVAWQVNLGEPIPLSAL